LPGLPGILSGRREATAPYFLPHYLFFTTALALKEFGGNGAHGKI